MAVITVLQVSYIIQRYTDNGIALSNTQSGMKTTIMYTSTMN